MKLSSLILSICSITTDGAPGKSSKNFQKNVPSEFSISQTYKLTTVIPRLEVRDNYRMCRWSRDGFMTV